MADGSVQLSTPTMNSAVSDAQARIHQNATIRAGKDALNNRRDTYFVKLDSQTDDQFKAMIQMAPMYILYPKVVDGFSGTVFSKAPVIKGVEFSDKQKEYNKNCDMLGNGIDKFSEKIVNTVFENGFCATLNDYSDTANRPFLTHIAPHQFVSFRTSSIKGYPVITQFIYVEDVEVDNPDNEFDVTVRNRYIVLDMHQDKYRVRKFLATTEKKLGDTTNSEQMEQEGTEVYPVIDGNNFKTIPITIHGANENNFSIDKSPLQDISDMNISVMQRTVDQVYMLHWTALPTPWTTGVDENDAQLTIGPSKSWAISNPDAKVGMLEFSGSSARAHQDFIENLLSIMANIGAQILKKEGVSRETATSVLVRTAAQTSLISTLVNNVSSQIENVLETFFLWGGTKVADDFAYKLNDDFIKVDMEPNAQIALVKSWLDGAISHKTMFNKMKEGELIDTNTTFDEEISEIEKNPPPFFAKAADQKNAVELADKAAETAEKVAESAEKDKPDSKDDTNGSDQDNGNINSPVTD